MHDIAITYPEGMDTTEEEREFDSFLLLYLTDLAAKQGSPKVRFNPDEVLKAWEERSLIRH